MRVLHKPGIPPAPQGDNALHQMLSALKENVEIMTGVRGGLLGKLPLTATLADVVVSLNAVIDRLNQRD